MQLRCDDLVVRELDGEVVMLSFSTSTYFSANAAGAVLIRELAVDVDVATLAATLAAEFEIAPDDAALDVLDFVGQLRDHGLLED
jgi:hypothetical protein